ncbi:MAG TPA: hypothetical protein VGQ71_05435 [Terriglobales bacterium]|jgi:hypothetical protein|nr:hypothetical protein [Terriglobales bacterium]
MLDLLLAIEDSFSACAAISGDREARFVSPSFAKESVDNPNYALSLTALVN